MSGNTPECQKLNYGMFRNLFVYRYGSQLLGYNQDIVGLMTFASFSRMNEMIWIMWKRRILEYPTVYEMKYTKKKPEELLARMFIMYTSWN